MNNNTIPRRSRVDLYTPAETACRNAIFEIEKMAADPRLTKAQCLIDEARCLVADHVDEQLEKTI